MLVVVDVETTGIPGKIASHLLSITDIGAVLLDEDNQEVSHFELLVRPKESVLKFRAVRQALDYTGITVDQLRADGIPAAEAARDVWAWLAEAGNPPTAAYNAAFDFRFLDRKPWCWPTKQACCLLLRAHRFMMRFCDPDAGSPLRWGRGRWLWPKLIDAARFVASRGHEIPLDQEHRALSDARLAAALHRALDTEGAAP